MSSSVGTLVCRSGMRRGESEDFIRLRVIARSVMQLIPLGRVVAIFPFELLLGF